MEVRRARGWHEDRRLRAARGFDAAVARALSFLAGHDAGPSQAGTESASLIVRKWPVRRYPFCIFFRQEPVRILVLAVAHTRRRPGYWRSRR